jgi:hypothetical protein
MRVHDTLKGYETLDDGDCLRLESGTDWVVPVCTTWLGLFAKKCALYRSSVGAKLCRADGKAGCVSHLLRTPLQTGISHVHGNHFISFFSLRYYI